MQCPRMTLASAYQGLELQIVVSHYGGCLESNPDSLEEPQDLLADEASLSLFSIFLYLTFSLVENELQNIKL